MSWTNKMNLSKAQKQAKQADEQSICRALYVYYVNSASEHRKQDQKHPKGEQKISVKYYVCCVL